MFALFGILGVRLPVVLIIGYCLHGIWDMLHEVHAYGRVSPFGAHELTELPLAYGAFCALLVEKSEAASALIYWDGKRYVWSQQGD